MEPHLGQGHFFLLQLPETPSARQPSCICSSRTSTTPPPALWTPATRSRKLTPKVRPVGHQGWLPEHQLSALRRSPQVSTGSVFSRGRHAIGWQGAPRALISELAPFRWHFHPAPSLLLPFYCVCSSSLPFRCRGAFGSGSYISDPPHAKGRGKSVLLSELTCRSRWRASETSQVGVTSGEAEEVALTWLP